MEGRRPCCKGLSRIEHQPFGTARSVLVLSTCRRRRPGRDIQNKGNIVAKKLMISVHSRLSDPKIVARQITLCTLTHGELAERPLWGIQHRVSVVFVEEG